jgi:signal transduction histidine kinase/CheY-like chemotaxis protein/HAMP domain-containing protein
MVDPGSSRTTGPRLSLGRTLTLSLLGLTLVLGVIAALSVGDLLSSRQRHEDALARSYRLEAASARLLAAGVLEEEALGRTDRGGAAARRRARRVFAATVDEAGVLAGPDAASARLVRARADSQRRTRRLAAAPSTARSRAALAASLRRARRNNDALAARQEQRRVAARERTREETRDSLLVAGIAGGLALLGAMVLIGTLLASIRRPLDDLVGATRRYASGRLDERVEPSGPEEIRDLGGAFNQMAEQLEVARNRVEEERQRLAVTVESLGDALVVVEDDGRVSAANPRAATVMPELRIGAKAAYGEEGTLPPLGEALAGEVMREQGDRTLSITAARLGAGGGVVWTIRDVSERARMERVKSDFVATASHELRSPLTSIKGFAELLERSEGLSEREREFAEVILSSTDRLVELVDDLLDVARLEAGQMEVHPRLFDLAETVRDVARLMEPQLTARRQILELDLPAVLPRALADPGHARQIVTNLLSNANRYTGEGGVISVSLREDDAELVLDVADNGTGMSGDELEVAFERFARRGGEGGTGLGLSIVRSLVELQRGEIEVESELGRGSRFTVRLPAEAPGAIHRPEPRAAIRGRRVLVVDDEPESADVIAGHLRAFGAETVTVNSGDEALRRLRDDQFDALTLDVIMPERNGFDVLRALRSDPGLRRTPVVVVSVFSGNEALFGEWRLAKPVDAEELADALGSAVLAGRTRLLVVGRSQVRPELEPALLRLGLDHEWVTSGAAAARACADRRFEVALVDAGMREPQAVLDQVDLRGRRLGRAVLVFSSEGEDPGLADTVPLPEAAGAVLEALSEQVS